MSADLVSIAGTYYSDLMALNKMEDEAVQRVRKQYVAKRKNATDFYQRRVKEIQEGKE